MKYSDKNKPLVCMQTQSTCYKGTRTMQVLGVLWHSTGANNPNLKRYVQPSDNDPNKAELLKLLGKNANGNDWNHVYRQAGLNCWIGKLADGTVTTVQTMPWNYRPWGCGSGSKGSCNSGWVQFECCEDGLTDTNYFNKVYQEACEITAYICKLYNIDPHGTVTVNGVKIPTILCHYDSYKLGFGGNHSDIYGWFPKFGKSMETARNDVAALLKNSGGSSAPIPVTGTVVNYKAKVAANSGLNCRTQPSTSGSLIKTYPFGTVLTIIQEKNGWGDTGEGWVSLTYVSKLPAEEKPEEEIETYEEWKAFMDQYRTELSSLEVPDWAKTTGEWDKALELGIIADKSRPQDFASRCEVAAMITRSQND